MTNLDLVARFRKVQTMDSEDHRAFDGDAGTLDSQLEGDDEMLDIESADEEMLDIDSADEVPLAEEGLVAD